MYVCTYVYRWSYSRTFIPDIISKYKTGATQDAWGYGGAQAGLPLAYIFFPTRVES